MFSQSAFSEIPSLFDVHIQPFTALVQVFYHKLHNCSRGNVPRQSLNEQCNKLTFIGEPCLFLFCNNFSFVKCCTTKKIVFGYLICF